MKSIEQGNVVAEYRLGSSQIFICDDYCRGKTEEDIEKILSYIADDIQASLTAYGGSGHESITAESAQFQSRNGSQYRIARST